MADQVVTELVIDADTSGADRYSAAMDRAGGSSEKTSESLKATGLAIAGIGAAAIAAVASLRGFVDLIGNQAAALADIATHAAIAGTSLKEFQQNLFAARTAGLTEKDFTAGFDKLAQNLLDAGRGSTQFGKLLEENGVSIRNVNGELKTAKQTMMDLAGLMERATPAQQQAVARISGISQSWVGFLKDGVAGIEAQKRAAEELGLIIDDATIKKAEEFTKQWRLAVAVWDTQFKASLASIMPLLIQLAEKAIDLINGIGSFVSDISRLVMPVDKMNKSQLNDQLESLYKFRDTIEDLEKKGQAQGVSEGILQKALGLPAGASVQDIDQMIGHIAALLDKGARVVIPTGGPGINLPRTDSGGGRDALETEIDRIEKHIAIIKADTEAVGQSEAARAGLRAEATLYAAAERAGFKDLEQFAEKFMKIREEVEKTTQELNKARVASDIKFGQQSVGLSQEDVQIAQQLRNIYPDVATALASIEAQGIRVNNAQKLLADGFREVGKSMLSAFLSGKNVMDAMVQSLDNLAKKLADSAFDNILTGLMTGNLAQAGIGAAQAVRSALISAFTGDQKAKKALAEAEAAWAKMTKEVTAFKLAVAGIDLGPLTSKLQSLFSSFQSLIDAAVKAKDAAGQQRLEAGFQTGAVRIVNEFVGGGQKLSELEQAMKAVKDEAAGLIATFNDLGYAYQAGQVADALPARLAAIAAQFAEAAKQALILTQEGLLSDIRNNSGVGYLNTIADAIKKFNEVSAQGVDPGVATAWLASTTQGAINGAKLTGDAYAELIALYPQLINWTHEFIDAEAAAAKAAADATQKLSLQLRLLTATTDASTLGGALTLFDAKAKQERDAAIAAGTSLENLALLDASLSAERLNIQNDFNQKFIDAEKQRTDAALAEQMRLKQYWDNLLGGSSSTLSPRDKLDASRSQLITQAGLAQGGDAAANSSITSYIDNFLQASRAYNASSEAFQKDFAFVQSILASLVGGLGGSTATSTSSISGVSQISSVSSASAANTNFASAFNDLSAKVVSLQAALEAKLSGVKDAVDTNSKIVAAAHEKENETLEDIDGTLKDIRSSSGNRQIAGPL